MYAISLPITWLKPPAGRARGPVCWGAALLGAGRLTGIAWHRMLWAPIILICRCDIPNLSKDAAAIYQGRLLQQTT